jgi:hypothetical protein
MAQLRSNQFDSIRGDSEKDELSGHCNLQLSNKIAVCNREAALLHLLVLQEIEHAETLLLVSAYRAQL